MSEDETETLWNPTCDSDWSLTTSIAVAFCILFGMFTFIIGVSALSSLRNHQNASTKELVKQEDIIEDRYIKILYYVQWMYFLLCIAFSILNPLTMIMSCDPFRWGVQPWWMDNAWGWTVATVYQYHWNGFISIFFLRLQICFNGPSLDSYNGYNWISMIVICTATAGHTVNAIMSMMGRWSAEIVAASTMSYIIMMSVCSQCLAFIFVQRLFRLNALANTHTDDTSMMITAITKMTVIAVISIVGSILIIWGLAANVILRDDSPWNVVLFSTGSIGSVFIDTLCISLSINGHQKWYLRICKCVDWRLKKCCVKLTDRVARRKEVKLAVVIIAQQVGEKSDSQRKGTSANNGNEGAYAQ